MKKIILSLLVAAMLTTSVYATDFDESVKNTNIFFKDRPSAPTWLFEKCKEETDRTIVLETDTHNLTFYSDDMSNIDDRERYDLELTTKSRDLTEFDNWVGRTTPKVAITFANGASLPGKTHITIKDGWFAPHSTVNIYQRTAPYQYKVIATDVKVQTNREYAFAVTEGGEYLVSTRSIDEKFKPFEYARPELEGSQIDHIPIDPSNGLYDIAPNYPYDEPPIVSITPDVSNSHLNPATGGNN